MKRNFAVLILTNKRPDRVYTYPTLRRSGYTGKIYLVLDNLDGSRDQYIEEYGDQVVIFDKAAAADFDVMDNFGGLRGVVYARNAAWKVAAELGLTHFVALDDDYNCFTYRFNERLEYVYQEAVEKKGNVRNLDEVFEAILDFLDDSGAHSVAMAQGGDYLGGIGGCNPYVHTVCLMRKCMNSFFCRTDKPFKFIGRINEDVNTYTQPASIGLMMLSTNQVSLSQHQTQSNPGGLTEIYLDAGTYVKSFYTVMCQPSSAHVAQMGNDNPRIHHKVKWRYTVPKIVRESLCRR